MKPSFPSPKDIILNYLTPYWLLEPVSSSFFFHFFAYGTAEELKTCFTYLKQGPLSHTKTSYSEYDKVLSFHCQT